MGMRTEKQVSTGLPGAPYMTALATRFPTS